MAQGYSVDSSWDMGFYSNFKLNQFDFKNIPPSFLSSYDVVIHLAAHSSISMCEADPIGSYRNDVTNFFELVHKLRPDQTFIYASSASVLSGEKGLTEESNFLPPMCHYDFHKQTIERIAQFSGKRTYGLRFGTVSGYSKNPRLETLVNSMYCDAVDRGQVRLCNGEKYRAMLGLPDLCRAISRMIDKKGPTGVYNLASQVMSINEVAGRIVAMTGAELVVLPPTDLCYDFRVNSSKFEETYSFKFEDTVESIIEDLKTLSLSLRDKTIYNRSTRLIKYE